MLINIFNIEIKSSRTFEYKNEIFAKIQFFPFYIFLPNIKRNRISKNGLWEHIFKEIFNLKMQKKNSIFSSF